MTIMKLLAFSLLFVAVSCVYYQLPEFKISDITNPDTCADFGLLAGYILMGDACKRAYKICEIKLAHGEVDEDYWFDGDSNKPPENFSEVLKACEAAYLKTCIPECKGKWYACKVKHPGLKDPVCGDSQATYETACEEFCQDSFYEVSRW
eukprot:TRINITY_DN17361_c0_g1_i3.p2 TRINITY_DN17361_c0_g1~~TRINITY_DN17361_c0_g1_i3.p2  ORF type:complete len:150 (-),score=14.49 TRINITY_DN17361_c0_g1_i3:316-765(-)